MTKPTPARRAAALRRTTKETDIEVAVCLHGAGEAAVETGIGFFDHMLTHIAKHALIDLTVRAKGDLHVDDHHTVEDVGIALGRALDHALGDRSGIVRYGHAFVPMDEALVLCALDISGRGMSVCELQIGVEKIGEFSTETVPEFFRAVAHNAGITIHIRQFAGTNGHHVVEAAFKAFARALGQAIALSEQVQGVPSTKGVL